MDAARGLGLLIQAVRVPGLLLFPSCLWTGSVPVPQPLLVLLGPDRVVFSFLFIQVLFIAELLRKTVLACDWLTGARDRMQPIRRRLDREK